MLYRLTENLRENFYNGLPSLRNSDRGQSAYKQARKGEVFELAPRPIEVQNLELTPHDIDCLAFSLTCTKGTYIRSLARDMGTSLGNGAHLIQLTRTAVGNVQLEDCFEIEDCIAMLERKQYLGIVKVYTKLEELNNLEHCILTIGSFDGLHLGHQALIRKVTELAKASKTDSAMLTFHPHPRAILGRDGNPVELITTMKERVRRLEQLELDHLAIIPFTRDLSEMQPLAYVEQYIAKSL